MLDENQDKSDTQAQFASTLSTQLSENRVDLLSERGSMKNVLILGAGVSQQYGYPSGPKLVELITAKINAKGSYRSSVDMKFVDALNITPLNSIDAFLKTHTEYDSIAKAAIADILFHKEDHEKLFSIPTEDCFYKYLFSELEDDSQPFSLKDYAFVTFNYDRSLEHFLVTVLLEQKIFKSRKEAFSFINERIVHIHGRLPSLMDEENYIMENSRHSYDYGYFKHLKKGLSSTVLNINRGTGRVSSPDFDRMKDHSEIVTREVTKYSSTNFQTVYQNNNRNERAENLIKNADRLFFLGFSYHELNMDILNYKGVRSNGRTNVGTIYGLSNVKKRKLERLYPEIKFYPCTALELFKTYYSLSDPQDDVKK